MSVTQAFTNQGKKDFFRGVHLPSHEYRMALYLASNANLNVNTTAYTSVGELVDNAGGYHRPGIVLVGYTVNLIGNIAYIDWTTDPSWSDASFSSDSALIYNNSVSTGQHPDGINKPAIAVLSFSLTNVVNGTFVAQLPAPGTDGSTALIRMT